MDRFLSDLQGDVLGEWRSKSKNALYRSDPEAWLADVLGSRWHKAQREVVDSFLTRDRILVKSGNGSGKSRLVSELISWAASVHDPGEVLSIVSAPTLRQVEEVIFAYLKSNMSAAKLANVTLPGMIDGSLRWTRRESARSPSRTLVLGMKPSERDTVSTFQGIRAQGSDNSDSGGMTWVFFDEAGGVPSDLFTAAEAVTTGAGNKITGIGNPDRLGTEFWKNFTDPKLMQDWALHTISVLDLPTITGEIVYPDDPVKQQAMLQSGMNDQAWVDHKKRAWGEESARYRSKVLGEFPDADDRSFFSQKAIDTANDTEIMPDTEQGVRLGVDVARFGEDDSMAYTNIGGHIRKVDSWSKATTNESASRIDTLAREQGAHVVTIDAAGLGAGIADQVAARAVDYSVIKTLGAYRSTDPTIWLNARAQWYDLFRQAMMEGRIDLDLTADTQLREELLIIQYDFTPKGQIQIESKKDMASRGIKSPDALDAVVYSFITTEAYMGGTNGGLNKNEIQIVDPFELAGVGAAGLPI